MGARARNGWGGVASSTRARTSRVAVAAVATIVFAACSSLPTPPPYVGAGPRVAVAGDSITLFSVAALQAAFIHGGYSVSVTGLFGHTTKNGASAVEAYRATKPTIVIVEWGTNDVFEQVTGVKGYTMADYQRRMTSFGREFPKACFIVTTSTTHRISALGANVATVNQAAAALNSWLRATFPMSSTGTTTSGRNARPAISS
jgi:hypothetical protein